MSRLLVSNNKDLYFLINNNENVPKTTTKQLPSYYDATRMLNMSYLLILDPSILDIYSYKSKHITRNKNSLIMSTNVITKKQNKSDPLILVVLMESIYSCESKYTNTKNDDNKRDGTSTCIHAIRRYHLQKNRKMVIKSDSNKSERDEISDVTDKNTKKTELGISNSSIKIHISCSLVWLNLSALNSTKQKLILSPVLSMLDPTKHNPQSSSYKLS